MYSQTSFVINSDAQLFTNSNFYGFFIRIKKTFCQITAMQLVKEPEGRHGMTSAKTDLARKNFNHFHILIWPIT